MDSSAAGSYRRFVEDSSLPFELNGYSQSSQGLRHLPRGRGNSRDYVGTTETRETPGSHSRVALQNMGLLLA